MEAKELRIGNIVNLTDEAIKDFYRVTEVELNKEQVVEALLKEGVLIEYDMELFHYAEIKPIPLTEEWLLKFGFEISGSNVFLNQVYLKSKGLIEPFWYIYKYNYTYIEIKHVHQLQNLYFALTNEELTIK